MAVKKKTPKKKIQKSTKKIIKKSTKKTDKKTSKKMSWARSQKMIDDVLVKISPSLQGKINHLVAVLENSREGKLGDLSFLGGKILLRAQEVSRGLKALKDRKTSKKKS